MNPKRVLEIRARCQLLFFGAPYQLMKRFSPQCARFGLAFGKHSKRLRRTMRTPYLLLLFPQQDEFFFPNGLGSAERRHFKNLPKDFGPKFHTFHTSHSAERTIFHIPTLKKSWFRRNKVFQKFAKTLTENQKSEKWATWQESANPGKREKTSKLSITMPCHVSS